MLKITQTPINRENFKRISLFWLATQIFNILRMKPWLLIQSIYNKYGPRAILTLGNNKLIILGDGEVIHHMETINRRFFIKGEPVEAIYPTMLNLVPFQSNKFVWKSKRENSTFGDERLPKFYEEIFPSHQIFLETKIKREFQNNFKNFEMTMIKFVYEFQSQITFGHNLGDQSFKDFWSLFAMADVRMKTNLPILFPGYKKKKERWYQQFSALIGEKSAQGEYDSLLALRQKFSTQTRAHMAGEFGAIFPGGVFSVSSFLVNALHELTKNPQLRDKLSKKIRSINKTFKEISEIIELEQFIHEVFRLYPPVPLFMRRCDSNHISMGGYKLDKNSRFIISIAPVHLDANLYPNPKKFDPTRWNEEVVLNSDYESKTFYPFGLGPRSCGGKGLSLYMVRSFLCAYLNNPQNFAKKIQLKSNRFFFGCTLPSKVKYIFQ